MKCIVQDSRTQWSTLEYFSSDWSILWIFALWHHQRAVTRLENVRQLNEQWGKKLDINLLHTQPPNVKWYQQYRFLEVSVKKRETQVVFLVKVSERKIHYNTLPQYHGWIHPREFANENLVRIWIFYLPDNFT